MEKDQELLQEAYLQVLENFNVDWNEVERASSEYLENMSYEEKYNSGVWKKGKKDPSFEEYNIYIYENLGYGFFLMKDESGYSESLAWYIVGEYRVDDGPDYSIIDDWEYEEIGDNKREVMQALSYRTAKDYCNARAIQDQLKNQR